MPWLGEEAADLPHQSLSLVRFKDGLGVRGALEDDHLLRFRGLLVMGADPGQTWHGGDLLALHVAQTGLDYLRTEQPIPALSVVEDIEADPRWTLPPLLRVPSATTTMEK